MEKLKMNEFAELRQSQISPANIYNICNKADWSTTMLRIKSKELLAQAFLCQKEAACRMQSPLIGALEQNTPIPYAGSLWHQGPPW